jgi:hypothetical protein
MIIMSNVTKNHKMGIVAIFVAAALVGSVIAFGNDNMAFATKKHNDSEQEIEQGQANEQNAQCVSGEFTLASCNNVGIQLQEQLGNLALGQR